MGESETIAKEVEKGLATYRIPIVGTILGILGVIMAATISTIIGPVSGFGPTAETSMMAIIVIGLITAYIKRLRLSWEDYVVIFALTYTGPITHGGASYYALPLWTNSEAWAWFNRIRDIVPSMFIGPKDLYEMALKGATAPPWGALAPYAATGFLFTFIYALAMIFACAPFRRQIVEIERIPFPVATATYSTILNLYAEGEEAKAPILGTRRNWVLLGFVVGFLLTAFTEGYLISTIKPEWPVIPANIPGNPWRTSLDIWKTGWVIVAGFQLSAMFPWGPFCFFWPLEALYSVVLAGLLTYLVIVPLEVRMGMIPSWNMETSYGYLWYLAFRREGIKFFFAGVVMAFGAVIGHYITGFKALRETWKENPPEIVGRYRTTALLALFGIVWFLIVGAMFGGHLGVVLINAIYMLFLVNIYYIRTIGEVNLMWGVWAIYFMHTLETAEALGAFRRGVEPVTTVHIGTYAPMMLLLYTAAMAGVGYMESQRFAFLAKVNPRKVFTTMIVGLIIAYIIQYAMSASLVFQFGLNARYYGQFGWGAWIFRYPYRVVHETHVIKAAYSLDYPGASSIAYWLCFILGIVLTWGRYAFNIPLSAIGLGFGMALTPWDWQYIAIPFLVIKWLLLRIGGGRLYERVGVPFFAGMCGGGLFAAFFAGLATYFKFLYGG